MYMVSKKSIKLEEHTAIVCFFSLLKLIKIKELVNCKQQTKEK